MIVVCVRLQENTEFRSLKRAQSPTSTSRKHSWTQRRPFSTRSVGQTRPSLGHSQQGLQARLGRLQAIPNKVCRLDQASPRPAIGHFQYCGLGFQFIFFHESNNCCETMSNNIFSNNLEKCVMSDYIFLYVGHRIDKQKSSVNETPFGHRSTSFKIFGCSQITVSISLTEM